MEQEYVDRLEAACDQYNELLEPLRSFVLPGGTVAASHLHVARTVVRRAERSTWAALAEHGDSMSPLTATYLNRLSDLLFIVSRVANLPRSTVAPATCSGSQAANASETQGGPQAAFAAFCSSRILLSRSSWFR